MATNVYEENIVRLIDGTEIVVTPSKIKYLKSILSEFSKIANAKGEDETLDIVIECVRLAMKEFYPQISNSVNEIEDNFDIKEIYKVLQYCAGIKLNKDNEEDVEQQAKSENEKGSNWEDLDLAKLESEVFMIGAWRNYEELETSISMPELVLLLETKRKLDYEDKKFLGAIQGVDIEENKKEDAWEEMKKRILYKGRDANDITNLTGAKAKKAGFGIGNGLEYEEITI